MFEGLIPTLQPTPDAPLADEAIKRRRRLADELVMQGTDASPIRSPWQGAARMAQALLGGWEGRKADEAETENAKYNSDLLGKLLAPSVSGAVTPNPTPGAQGGSDGTSAPVAAPKPMSGDYLPMFAQAGTRWGV